MKGVTVLAAVLLLVAMVQLMAEPSEAAISCGQVSSALAPCVPYLTGGGTPSASCCSGVRTLNGMAQTRPDRQAVCSCVQAAASNYPNIKPDAAQNLPRSCGVSLNVPISRTTNCRSIP